jgi:hypothetical protein
MDAEMKVLRNLPYWLAAGIALAVYYSWSAAYAWLGSSWGGWHRDHVYYLHNLILLAGIWGLAFLLRWVLPKKLGGRR